MRKRRVRRTERGWGGHFAGCGSCLFRRNTLLEWRDKRLVVSTVGLYFPLCEKRPVTVGLERYYETRAFLGVWKDPYWEADVTQEVPVLGKWTVGSCERESDAEANTMHEEAVARFMKDPEEWIPYE